jgi:hypothetical protein
MTENQQRFMRAIAGRIPPDRIAEVRLFPAIRQGVTESAVAVVAVETLEVEGERVVPLEVTPADVARVADTSLLADMAPLGEERVALPAAPRSLQFADLPVPSDAADETDVGNSHRTSPGSSALSAQRSPLRCSILTARYRLTIKGPDRGKWEFELVHDADAPLDTVERVVRGVARRVGDDEQAELLSPTDFQRAITEPWWTHA